MKSPKTYPLPPIGEEIGKTTPGSISINYDVDENGQTINIQVIESSPEGIIDREATKIIDRVIYRPRYSEAEAQATEGLNINHQYNVRLAEIDSEKTEDIETEIVDDTSDAPLQNPIE